MELPKVHPEFSKSAQANQSSLRLVAAIIFCLASIIPSFVEAEKESSVKNRIESITNGDLALAQNQKVETPATKN